jgi:uncharacterized protein (DUF697 family)
MNPAPRTNLSKNVKKIINNNVLYASGAGLIPLPLIDFAAILAIQLNMVKLLAEEYGITGSDYNKHRVKSIIGSLVGSISAMSLIKIIPGLGQLLGGATTAVSGAASTYALGKVFATHFAAGGTILDFNPEKIRKYYQQEYEKGKRIHAEIEREAKDQSKASIDFEKLEAELEKLDIANQNNLFAAADEQTDDLSQIKGIGNKTMEDLNKGGIQTFDDLAGKTTEEINKIVPRSSLTQIDQWIEQAKKLTDIQD